MPVKYGDVLLFNKGELSGSTKIVRKKDGGNIILIKNIRIIKMQFNEIINI